MGYIRQICEYLLGHKCIVFMDNNPLSHLSSAKLGALEQPWVVQLALFDFEIRYRSGKSNTNAYAISHLHPPRTVDLERIIPGMQLPQPLKQALYIRGPAACTGLASAYACRHRIASASGPCDPESHCVLAAQMTPEP